MPLSERWALDVEFYSKNKPQVLTAFPQCEQCRYIIKGNALFCEKYKEQRKPKYVMFPKKECPEFESDDLLKIEWRNRQEEMLYSGMFGFIAGDALGVPVEFTSREDREKDPVNEMRAYGTYHQPFGTWSDDTSLTLCLIASIVDGFTIENLAGKFINYYQKSFLTPYGEVFDIGITTRDAIEKMAQGVPPKQSGGDRERDNGNGSLMRVLPLAYYLKDAGFQNRMKLIEDVSSLTHAHKRSKLACIIYVEFAIHLLNGKDKKEALSDTVDDVFRHCSTSYKDEIKFYSRILNGGLELLPEERINSSGYVVDTLEAVLWSFMTTDCYANAVLRAINLGGDTDTIAAITGGIAGIYYGFESIPQNWIQCLARKKEIHQMLKDFNGKI